GQLVAVAEGVVDPADGALRWSDGARSIALVGDELVSMNCWGFQPSVLAPLNDAFARFVASGGVESGEESLLPSVVSGLLPKPGGASMTVLSSEDRCLGVTHASDADIVRSALTSR